MSSGPDPDSKSLARSINYHGDKLLKLLITTHSQFVQIMKLQEVDYKINKDRMITIRRLGSYVEDVINFIGSKANYVFVREPQLLKINTSPHGFFLDQSNHQYPLEYLLKVKKETRLEQLVKNIKVGDVWLVLVNHRISGGFGLKFISYGNRKLIYFPDLLPADLQIFLYSHNIPSEMNRGGSSVIIGSRLRVLVSAIDVNEKSVEVEVSLVATEPDMQLGRIKMADIPVILSSVPRKIPQLSSCLEKMRTYKNPKSIEYMAKVMNVSLKNYSSFMSSLRNPYPKEDSAKALHNKQLAKWAHRYVVEGVQFFKDEKNEEAFQSLERALSIHPENEEALVAKGGILANMGRYEKAVEEFEKVLKTNPNHINAKDYTCRTLLELGREFEEKNDMESAEKTYVRCVATDSSNPAAVEAAKAVSKFRNVETVPESLIPFSTSFNEEEPSSEPESPAVRRNRSPPKEFDGSSRSSIPPNDPPHESYDRTRSPYTYRDSWDSYDRVSNLTRVETSLDPYDAKVAAFLKKCKVPSESTSQRPLDFQEHKIRRYRSSSESSGQSYRSRRFHRSPKRRKRSGRSMSRKREYRSKSPSKRKSSDEGGDRKSSTHLSPKRRKRSGRSMSRKRDYRSKSPSKRKRNSSKSSDEDGGIKSSTHLSPKRRKRFGRSMSRKREYRSKSPSKRKRNSSKSSDEDDGRKSSTLRSPRRRKRSGRSQSRNKECRSKSPIEGKSSSDEKDDKRSEEDRRIDELKLLQEKLERYQQKYGPITTASTSTAITNTSTDSNVVSSSQDLIHPAFRSDEEYTCAPPNRPKLSHAAKTNIHEIMASDLKQRLDREQKLKKLKDELKKKTLALKEQKKTPNFEPVPKRSKSRSPSRRGRSKSRSRRSRSKSRLRRSRSKSRSRRSKSRNRNKIWGFRKSRSPDNSWKVRQFVENKKSRNHDSKIAASIAMETKQKQLAAAKEMIEKQILGNPEPKQFGKWDSPPDDKEASKKESSSAKTTIEEYEMKLKESREKKLKEMRERNRQFLKPPLS